MFFWFSIVFSLDFPTKSAGSPQDLRQTSAPRRPRRHPQGPLRRAAPRRGVRRRGAGAAHQGAGKALGVAAGGGLSEPWPRRFGGMMMGQL